MGMLTEFKEFATRGNVLDLAIAVIIGAAFGSVVTSAVNDVIMPPIGMVAGQVNFKDLFFSLNGQQYATIDEAKKASAPIIAYGLFLNAVINFLIVAFIVFLIVKQVNRFMGPAPSAPATKNCPYCANAVPAIAVRCGFCTSDLARA
ncbi:MAG: large conductance mechanosensitive channel protein MscL [Bryobacteraceae bacterium]|nr:large conductance mechanosensitive channel protein MscL [Bryobacteraceae bacterium]